MATTPAEALARLERMVAWQEVPALSEADVAALLRLAQRPDRLQRVPTEAGWEPTYDLAAAAAEGWEWKASKAAGQYRFSSDGKTFDRQQVVENCRAQAAHYRTLAGSQHGGAGTFLLRSPHGAWPYAADQIGNL